MTRWPPTRLSSHDVLINQKFTLFSLLLASVTVSRFVHHHLAVRRVDSQLQLLFVTFEKFTFFESWKELLVCANGAVCDVWTIQSHFDLNEQSFKVDGGKKGERIKCLTWLQSLATFHVFTSLGAHCARGYFVFSRRSSLDAPFVTPKTQNTQSSREQSARTARKRKDDLKEFQPRKMPFQYRFTIGLFSALAAAHFSNWLCANASTVRQKKRSQCLRQSRGRREQQCTIRDEC